MKKIREHLCLLNWIVVLFSNSHEINIRTQASCFSLLVIFSYQQQYALSPASAPGQLPGVGVVKSEVSFVRLSSSDVEKQSFSCRNEEIRYNQYELNSIKDFYLSFLLVRLVEYIQ